MWMRNNIVTVFDQSWNFNRKYNEIIGSTLPIRSHFQDAILSLIGFCTQDCAF